MTKLLASVRNLDEAGIALRGGADIIDLKEPAHGALGAVAHEVARAVVHFTRARTPVSATIGDLPFRAAALTPAVAAMAATGVDYIKIGIFPTQGEALNIAAVRAELSEARLSAAAQSARLVAVLFADREPDFALIDAFAQTGFAGIMLDTADKARGTLRDHLRQDQLREFCARARARQLLTGLAGSLRAPDVAALLPLGADYLGFRGALCEGTERTAQLTPARIRAVRALLVSEPQSSTFGAAL